MSVFSRVMHSLRGRRLDRELDEELQSHLDEATASGRDARDARRALGSPLKHRQASRDALASAAVDGLARDLRLGLRQMRRQPVFSAVAILSLALGIGANTALFSIIDHVLLRPLPVAHADRLALLSDRSWTFPIWQELQRHRDLVDGMGAWSLQRLGVETAEGKASRDVLYVSGGFFELLGVVPHLGRGLNTEDDRQGGGRQGPAAVVSHAYWARHLRSAPAAIGTPLLVEGVSFVIVGVLPAGFFGPEVGRTFDVAVPLGTEPLIAGTATQLERRSSWWLNIMLRLKPQQSIEQVRALVHAIQPQVRAATLPSGFSSVQLERYLATPIQIDGASTGLSRLRGRYEDALLVLMGAVGLILLITCANLANLLLARASGRGAEMSMRLALGASRKRLLRQLLVENLLLTIGGASIGLVVALAAARALVSQLATTQLPVALDVTIDWRVLAFTAGVSTAATVVFGLLPAARATQVQPADALKRQGRTVVSGAGGPAQALVIVQVALSLVLVALAGLFVQTFAGMSGRPRGFEPDRVVVATVTLGRDTLAPDARPAYFERLRLVAEALPGVQAAAGSVVTPLSGHTWDTPVHSVDGRPLQSDDQQRLSYVNIVSSHYFSTMGVRLRQGRDFTDADTAGAPPVAIVNAAFVTRFLNGGPGVGQQFTTGEGEPARTIIGVVEDTLYSDPREPERPILYRPLLEGYDGRQLAISVRGSEGDDGVLARSLYAAAQGAGVPVTVEIVPLAQQVNESMAQERLLAALAATLGALALLICGIGLYGVTAYTVSRRRAELGLRIALGATPGGLLVLVLARVGLLVALGIVLGVAAARWAATAVGSLLYGLEPSDLQTLVTAAVLLLLTGGVAGALPAWRAWQTGPASVLRES